MPCRMRERLLDSRMGSAILRLKGRVFRVAILTKRPSSRASSYLATPMKWEECRRHRSRTFWGVTEVTWPFANCTNGLLRSANF